MSKPKTLNRKSFCIATLRRASMRWPPRNEAITRARIARGVYRCNMCQGEVRNKDKQVDHICPCVPTKGWVSFDSFIELLLPFEYSSYQILCKQCHLSKGMVESNLRKINKDKKKIDK